MQIKKCLAKGLPVVLLIASLNIVLLMPGTVAATELSAPNGAALTMIDKSLQELAENAEEHQTFADMAQDYLPADSAILLNEFLHIAQLDLTIEEKQAAVIEISQSACTTYLQIWILGEILHYFTAFDSLASLLIDIGLVGILLCLLGIA
jgi:hypothetical protein